MLLIATWGDVMHDIARGYVLKYGGDGRPDDHEIWDWVFSALHQHRELSARQRDYLAMELFKSIWDRLSKKGGCRGLH
ncbi:hypothetical protein OS035_24290 [Rhizobium sp. 268]|uniref:hypothetical protein n=1 Tax=Rhizobium sp. 268 TaxID=2996375 RepID=UPI002F951C1E